MSRLLSRLLSESVVYGLGAAASQIVGIILVPIYARKLGASEYGIVAILSTTISLSSVIAGLALAQAFFRTYLKDTATVAERRHVLATSVVLRAVLSGVAGILIALLSVPLAVALFGDAARADLLLYVAAIVFVDTTTVIPLSYLRAERRPFGYAMLALTRATLGSALVIVFVVVVNLGVRGVLLGSLGAAVITAAAGTAILIGGGVRLGWDGVLVRSMLAFSLPLVPAAAASWALSFIDRFFLQAMDGSRIVGIYAAGYTVGLAVNVFVVQPFTLMWGAAKWDIYRDEERAPWIFARVTTAFAVVGSFMALGAAAFGTDVMRVLLTTEFEPGRFVVPFSAFAAVLYGVYTLAGTGLNIAARTGWIAAAFIGAAGLNIVLNIVLIPPFGFMGAAYATVAGYAALALVTGLLSERYYSIPWQIPQTVAALGLGFALGVAALVGPDALAWRLACFVVYLPLLLALRVVRAADVRVVRDTLIRRG